MSHMFAPLMAMKAARLNLALHPLLDAPLDFEEPAHEERPPPAIAREFLSPALVVPVRGRK